MWVAVRLIVAVVLSAAPVGAASPASASQTWRTTGSWVDSVFVSDVDCVTANYCVAVGTLLSFQTGEQSALVMRNTGRGWVRDPSVTTADVALVDVDCTSSTHCLALGQSDIVAPSG